MKTVSTHLKVLFGLGLAVSAMLTAIPQSRAQSLEPALPPMSVAKAKYFKNNPEAWNEFLSQLPRAPGNSPQRTAARVVPDFGGSWELVTTAPNGICNPQLLTDGTVMAQSCNAPQWYKLTPDISGNYADGVWSTLAPLPVIGGTQYAPLYHASAVLPDGRLIIMGGEYNGAGAVWTNLGAIYDPTVNAWTAVTTPTNLNAVNNGDGVIGDAESAVLADGRFLLGGCCAYPDADDLLDATNLGWTATGAPNDGTIHYQDEQGYELLPDGNVLTIDIWNDNGTDWNVTAAEQYVPSSGTWVSAGNMPVSLVDPCGNAEIGPAALRPDGTLVAFGGNAECSPVPDPTAIYNSSQNAWTAGPNVPSKCSGGTSPCTLADAPAAVLPSGNVLIAASPGYTTAGTHFFEFTTSNTISQVSDPIKNASSSPAYAYNYLVLPSGQVLMTDFSTIPEIYTPTGSATASWAPAISNAPSALYAGGTYVIGGTQFNGLSQGAYYGDDNQASTNYPIVQITNSATGHVFYGRTFDHSTMSIAAGQEGTTNLTVPAGVETGPSSVVVIANGIASEPVNVAMQRSAYAKAPDFNGDGDSDILWRNATGQAQIWFMNGGTHTSTANLGVVTTAMSIVGTGDFDGDGKTDILWRNSDGQVQIWFMNGGTHTTANLGVISNQMTIVGTGDFDGDGKTDILWRNANGQVQIWFMTGATHTTANLGVISNALTIVGTGDFNGDGKTDILWRNSNGHAQIWFMTGATQTTANLGVIPIEKRIVGTSDFDGNGKADILWRDADGQVSIWFMNGATHVSTTALGVIPLAQSIVQ